MTTTYLRASNLTLLAAFPSAQSPLFERCGQGCAAHNSPNRLVTCGHMYLDHGGFTACVHLAWLAGLMVICTPLPLVSALKPAVLALNLQECPCRNEGLALLVFLLASNKQEAGIYKLFKFLPSGLQVKIQALAAHRTITLHLRRARTPRQDQVFWSYTGPMHQAAAQAARATHRGQSSTPSQSWALHLLSRDL